MCLINTTFITKRASLHKCSFSGYKGKQERNRAFLGHIRLCIHHFIVNLVFGEELVSWVIFWALWTVIFPAYIWIVHSTLTFTEDDSMLKPSAVIISWSPCELVREDPTNAGATGWFPSEFYKRFLRIWFDLWRIWIQAMINIVISGACWIFISHLVSLGRWKIASWPGTLGLGAMNSRMSTFLLGFSDTIGNIYHVYFISQ